jgi:hypothetical protein
MHSLSRRLAALVAALLMALPASALGRSQYFCIGMGVARDSCCCKAKRAAEQGCGTQIKASDCCRVLERASRDATPAVREAAQQILPSALLAILPPFGPQPLDVAEGVRSATRLARAPPLSGPPLFLKNCALLS